MKEKQKKKKERERKGAKARIWIAMGAKLCERGKEKKNGTRAIRDCVRACGRLSNRVTGTVD